MLGKKNNNVQSGTVDQDSSAYTSADDVVDMDDGFSDFFDNPESSDNGSGITDADIQNNQAPQDLSQGYEEEDAQVQQPEPIHEPEEYEESEPQYQSKPYQQSNMDQSVNKTDMVLYIIADKKENGLTAYFRESGIKVSAVFDDITDAKNAILMQSMPTRIVIVDSGKGKFTLTKVREDIIDMLGISDEQNKTTVFYTDSALKVDALRTLGKAGKEIDWIPYKSTHIVAGTILAYKENYVYDMEEDVEAREKSKDILSMRGFKYTGEPSPRMEPVGLTPEVILKNVINGQGEQLKSFEIKL